MEREQESKDNRVKYLSGPAWCHALFIATPLLAWPLNQYLHVSLFITPFLILLPWLPFLMMEYVRRNRVAQQEKQSLQSKFDAQDSALCGGELN